MAVRQDLARELEQNRAAAGEEMPTRGVFRCTLKSPPKKLIEAE
jgi:hypothetical protein